MNTLVPITWLYVSSGVFLIIIFAFSVLVARNISLARQWEDQFFCARELANHRRIIIETQRARLNRSLAAIREIGHLVKGSTFEIAVAHICQEAASEWRFKGNKIETSQDSATYQGESFHPDELRDQALKEISKDAQFMTCTCGILGVEPHESCPIHGGSIT